MAVIYTGDGDDSFSRSNDISGYDKAGGNVIYFEGGDDNLFFFSFLMTRYMAEQEMISFRKGEAIPILMVVKERIQCSCLGK